MSDVTRDEFDRLVERVGRVEGRLGAAEKTLGATVEILASEVVGLRTYLDERFAAVDARFDHEDRMLDSLANEVQVEFDNHAETLHGHGRKLDALLTHFGVEPPDD